MSWDSYIKNILGHARGSADRACIIGVDGSMWTSYAPANSLKLSADEAAKIGKAFGAKDFSGFQAGGILAEGVKYMFLRAKDNLALAKKKDYGALSMQSSKTAVVIAHTAEGQSQGDANNAVGVVAKHLESLGM